MASIATVGDNYDSALAQSVVGLYKTECVSIGGPIEKETRTTVRLTPSTSRRRENSPSTKSGAIQSMSDTVAWLSLASSAILR